MAQIQELQEQLNRLHRQSSAADGNGAAARRFASADIMAFDCYNTGRSTMTRLPDVPEFGFDTKVRRTDMCIGERGTRSLI